MGVLLLCLKRQVIDIAHVIDAIISLQDQFSGTLRNVNQNLSQFQRQANYISKDVSKVGRTIEGVGSGLTTTVTMPLVALGMYASKVGNEFKDGMAKVSTIADTTTVSLDKLGKGIINLSNETGMRIGDLIEAEYNALSAGVDTANSVKFLETAVKAAKGGFTDTNTAVDGLTTILNAYGLKASEVTKISDQMMLTQNFGKTTFGELSSSIGAVIPIAASLDVGTKELFGSLAVLTKNGINTSESVTGLKAAFSNIIKPATQASKLAQQLGLDFSAAHLKSVGWAKFLEEIKEKTGGNAEQMATLFGSVEALNTVMALTGKGAEDFNKVLEDMNNTAGLTEKAYNKMQTPGEKFRKNLNKLKNMLIGTSEELNPLLESLTGYTNKLADALARLTPQQQKALAKFLVMAATIGPVILVIGKMTLGIGNTIKSINNLSKAITKAGGVMKFLATPGSKVVIIITAIALAALLLMRYWGPISGFFKKTISSIAKTFGTSEQNVLKFASIFGNTLMGVMAVGKIFGIGTGGAFKVLFTIIKFVGFGIIGILKTIFTVMMANPILAIIAGIVLVVIGLYSAWKNNWFGIRDVTKIVIDGIKKLWNGLKEFLKHPITGTINLIKKATGSGGGENVGKNALGTSYWHGGTTWVGEHGPELIELPKGARVTDNRNSMHGGGNITIAKLAETIVVREDADIDRIANALVRKLQKTRINMA